VLRGVEGVGFLHFDEHDVVRNPLVQRIVKAYERYTYQNGAGRQLSLLNAEPAEATEPGKS